MPITTLSPLVNGPFPRGAVSTPKARLLGALPFLAGANAPPQQVAYVPDVLDYWGNDRYGICVTAEEAFAKGCQPPGNPAGVFIPTATCIAWARQHGVLNGASLDGVLADMNEKGFSIGSQLYNVGDYKGVNFSNQDILHAALAVGPVKIAINADALPSGTGSRQGWYVLGDNSNTRTDHCISIAGYGTAEFIFDRLHLPRPQELSANLFGYLGFSWSTLGFFDHEWIMGCTDEAWVRNPTTVGVPTLPIPPSPNPLPAVQPILSGKIFYDRDRNFINGGIAFEVPPGLPSGMYETIVVPNGDGTYRAKLVAPA